VRKLSVLGLQAAPVAGDPAATVAALRERAKGAKAVAPHADLLVLPELHLSALPPPLVTQDDYAESVAEPVPGPTTRLVGEIAAETGLWIVAGSIYERTAEGIVHNTVPVLSPDGKLVAAYRKVFTWQPHETCAPGTDFVTFDMPRIGRLGLANCYDASFPETCRALARMGAEVVVHVSLTTTSDRSAEIVLARANAIFNQLYFVSVNAAQPAGLGRSLVVDPEGLVRAQAGEGEELMTDVLDLDAVRRVREHGTAGVSRRWELIERAGVPELR
jgi:formamidase